jgi:hypothetical protein
MGSPEDKQKHSRRLKQKKRDKVKRVRSVIAKELITSGRYKQKIIKDRRGKEVVTFHDLVESIQEDDE